MDVKVRGGGGRGRGWEALLTKQDEVWQWGGRGKYQLYIHQRSFLVMIHPGKAQKARGRSIYPKVKGLQNSVLFLLDEIRFVIGPHYIFVDLWSAWDSSVWQWGRMFLGYWHSLGHVFSKLDSVLFFRGLPWPQSQF